MRYREIHITDQFEGFHKYENAPEEVAFLRNIHRHIFKVHAYIEVFHEEREVEFFMAKKVLKQIITEICSVRPLLGSCEWIAGEIMDALIKEYGIHRAYSVEVSEDGENGGSHTYCPEEEVVDEYNNLISR